MRLPLGTLGGVTDLIHDTRWKEGRSLPRRRAAVLRRYRGPGENLFVIPHGNTPAFFADLFAVWETGGCAVCVSPGLTSSELDNVTWFVQARGAVLVDGTNVTTDAAPVLCTAEEAEG